jgi:ribosome-associated heat shock protein Hsp15
MRVDRWLWAVRVFKSRNLAAGAIKGGRVLVDGELCKPAHELQIGEVVTVNSWDRERMWRVLDWPPQRMAAKRVPEFAAPVAPLPVS